MKTQDCIVVGGQFNGLALHELPAGYLLRLSLNSNTELAEAAERAFFAYNEDYVEFEKERAA